MQPNRLTLKSLLHWPHLPITILLSIALLTGFLTVQDYGLSWDEAGIYQYSERLLGAYRYVLHPQQYQPDTSIPVLNLYGPAHFMYATLMSHMLRAILPAWPGGAAAHFAYFITFLAGALFLYLLLGRWISQWAAFGAALLFITQPLFWGHALMNPKDTPFMALFIGSVYLGLRMMDDPKWDKMLAAGIALGITTSIRSLGPMAGALVLLYGLLKSPRRAITTAPWYIIITVIITYITWPYLWTGPIPAYRESLETMSRFPFDARILFWGDLYSPSKVPRSYVPTLFALQLTEPALVLIILGLFAMFLSRKKGPIFLFLGWFLLPCLAIILPRSILYDNARQLFFLLPPIFFAIGFALDGLVRLISNQAVRNALLVLAILPGLLAAVRLHPYEYTYYNSMIGGTRGAFHRFETDYWGLSFKEAMEYINANAPQNARILVLSGPDEIAAYYTRPDLQIVTEENDPSPQLGYDYALILTRKNLGERMCKKAETIYIVGRSGGVFTYVMKLGPTKSCNS